MSQTYHKIWIHLLWATKERAGLLRKEIRQDVFHHISQKAISERYILDTIGGHIDHVHCLIRLQPRFSVSEVANKLKGESSHWINDRKLTPTHFAWQGGFGAFSVSDREIAKVRTYILNQEEHHRKNSFTEEVSEFLEEYGLEMIQQDELGPSPSDSGKRQ